MKILIVAGGGGHFSAAYGVIKALPKNAEILVVGRKYALEGDSAVSLEYQIAQDEHIPFSVLTTGRIQRKFTKHTLTSLVKMPIGFLQSLHILHRFQPDVVVSFGGYIAVPVTLAASILRIPLVLHEQTLGAGIANLAVSRFAKKICVSWDVSLPRFPKDKTILTGNPVYWAKKHHGTEEIFKGKSPILLIVGGSSGSHAINDLIYGCLPSLLKDFYVIHQTGDAQKYKDFEKLEALRMSLPQQLQEKYHIQKFFSPASVQQLFAKASLVISRAGINTLTQLMQLQKPALLIPLPYGQHNEQPANAAYMANLGLAKVLEQGALSPELLHTEVRQLYAQRDTYKEAGKKAKERILSDAAQKVIQVIYDVGNEK